MKKLKDVHPDINRGKGLMKVQERQRRRKIAALKETTKEALVFTESYEVDLKSVLFETRESQPKTITLNYSNTSNSVADSPQSSQFIAEILYLLDTYRVSDDVYHEFSMINTSLPRSHKIKELKHLQEPYFGCYVSFPEYLNSTLSHLHRSGCMLQSPIEVKISGDGAPFYRSTSFIILSFSFPTLDPDSLSSTGMPS